MMELILPSLVCTLLIRYDENSLKETYYAYYFILATARIGLHALVLKKHIRFLILSSAAVLYSPFVLAPVSLSLIGLL